jgi:DNA-binding MarR family transcriptional regulator
MGHRPTQKEKTLRAFRAYFDLLDAADWMRSWMRAPLESFDLTMQGFRLLEMLYREGPVSIAAAAKRRGCKRQNIDVAIARLEERGWVRREVWRHPPVEIQGSRLPKAKRDQPRMGRRASRVRLTPLGEKFIGEALPSHAKGVKALMRSLAGREQDSLSRICGKLREGDILKFTSELTHEEVEEESEGASVESDGGRSWATARRNSIRS